MSLEVVEWDVVRLPAVPLWVAVSFWAGGFAPRAAGVCR